MYINELESVSGQKTFQEDGRWPLDDLYAEYTRLLDAGWAAEVIATQYIEDENGRLVEFPIYAFISNPELIVPTLAFWILGGIHGEEPAGPIAIAEEVELLIQMAKQGVPIVLLPQLNPAGYARDWRYENEIRDFERGQSVTDCEPLLHELPGRISQWDVVPRSKTAETVTAWVVEKLHLFMPLVVFDHHEDEFNDLFPEDPQRLNSYLYFYGDNKFTAITEKVVAILLANGMPIVNAGETRFGETITGGLVGDSADGSVDELLAAPFYVDDGKLKAKPYAKVVVVVETTRKPDGSIPVDQRVKAHREIIRNFPEFWRLALSDTLPK